MNMKMLSKPVKLFVIKNRVKGKEYDRPVIFLPNMVLEYHEKKDEFNVYVDHDFIILSKNNDLLSLSFVQEIIKDIQRIFAMMDMLFSEFTDSQRERILSKYKYIIEELLNLREKYRGE